MLFNRLFVCLTKRNEMCVDSNLIESCAGPSLLSSSLWGSSFKIILRLLHSAFGLISQICNSVSSIKGCSDLFISLYKSFKFDIQVLVLAT